MLDGVIKFDYNGWIQELYISAINDSIKIERDGDRRSCSWVWTLFLCGERPKYD